MLSLRLQTREIFEILSYRTHIGFRARRFSGSLFIFRIILPECSFNLKGHDLNGEGEPPALHCHSLGMLQTVPLVYIYT